METGRDEGAITGLWRTDLYDKRVPSFGGPCQRAPREWRDPVPRKLCDRMRFRAVGVHHPELGLAGRQVRIGDLRAGWRPHRTSEGGVGMSFYQLTKTGPVRSDDPHAESLLRPPAEKQDFVAVGRPLRMEQEATGSRSDLPDAGPVHVDSAQGPQRIAGGSPERDGSAVGRPVRH